LEKLTPKQQAFADYYIETGNATEAARRAGYSKKTARAIGQENLTKPAISEYIADRLDSLSEKRVADADEVMAFFSSVMRGEMKDAFGLDPSLDTRINAGKELMKRYAVTDKGKTAESKLDRLLEEFRDAVESETT
jgi:phage terminase small subunit